MFAAVVLALQCTDGDNLVAGCVVNAPHYPAQNALLRQMGGIDCDVSQGAGSMLL